MSESEDDDKWMTEGFRYGGKDVDDIRKSLLNLARGRPKGSKRKPREKLSPLLAQMMGEANMCYVTRDFSEAVRLLQEVIRNAPDVPAPYHTLGLIYEEMGEKGKALQYYMIAGQLTPNDGDLWKRLGFMSREEKLLEQAIYCYNKAVRLDGNDVDLLWDRAYLYHELGEINKAMDGYQQILRLRKNDLQVVKELARIYAATEQLDRAVELIENAFEEHPLDQNIDYTHINILAELYMARGDYEQSIKMIARESEMVRKRLKQQEHLLPLDLKVKLGICHLKLSRMDEAKKHLEGLYEKDPKEYSDLFFDVAETLYTMGQYEDALHIYVILSVNEDYNKPGIWLRLAKCYHELKDLLASTNAYLAVLQEMPERDDVRIALSEVYEEMGEHEKALQVMNDTISHENDTTSAKLVTWPQSSTHPHKHLLNPNEKYTCVDANEKVMVELNDEYYRKLKFLYHKCGLLYSMDNKEEFINVGIELFKLFKGNPYFCPERRRADFDLHRRPRKRRKRKDVLPEKYEADSSNISDQDKEMEDGMDSEPHVDSPESSSQNLLTFRKKAKNRTNTAPTDQMACEELLNLDLGLTIDEWLDFFVKLACTFKRLNQSDNAISVLDIAGRSNVFFIDQIRRHKLKILGLAIHFYNQHFIEVTDYTRWIINQVHSLFSYNLFCCSLSSGMDSVAAFSSPAVQKYFHRLTKFNHESIPVHIIYGHIMSITKSYKVALESYLQAYRLTPDDPFVLFCLGITYLHLAMQRKTPNRHLQILQGFSFLFRYFYIRFVSEPLESCYNLARGFHQVGLYHLAVPYYERVFQMSSSLSDPFVHETAYNLSLLYSLLGSPHLARSLLFRYCIIK